MDFQNLKVEFMVSFLLIYISGVGAIHLEMKNIDQFGYAFLHFLLYAVLLWTSKEITGAQIHPIIALFHSIKAENKNDIPTTFLYIIIQMMAAIFAVCLLRMSSDAERIFFIRFLYFFFELIFF